MNCLPHVVQDTECAAVVLLINRYEDIVIVS